MGNLRESRKGAIEGMFGYLTKQDTTDIVTPGESAKRADLFIAVNASTVELTDIEKYIAETVGDKPLIIWNMELDTLRSDLGNYFAKPFSSSSTLVLIPFQNLLSASIELFLTAWRPKNLTPMMH